MIFPVKSCVIPAMYLEQSSDEQLLERYLEGQVDAFNELLTRYERAMMAFHYRFCGNQHSAEEMFQDTFMRVIQHAVSFERKSSFRTWLFRIARNVAIDHCRKRKVREVIDYRSEPPETSAMSSGESKPIADHLLRTRISECTQKLPEEQRYVLFLKESEEMTFSEIAEVVQVNLGTVKSRMRYALQSLRDCLRHVHDNASLGDVG